MRVGWTRRLRQVIHQDNQWIHPRQVIHGSQIKPQQVAFLLFSSPAGIPMRYGIGEFPQISSGRWMLETCHEFAWRTEISNWKSRLGGYLAPLPQIIYKIPHYLTLYGAQFYWEFKNSMARNYLQGDDDLLLQCMLSEQSMKILLKFSRGQIKVSTIAIYPPTSLVSDAAFRKEIYPENDHSLTSLRVGVKYSPYKEIHKGENKTGGQSTIIHSCPMLHRRWANWV